MGSLSLDSLWDLVREEARQMSREGADEAEPFGHELLASHLTCNVLECSSMEEAVAHILADKLSGNCPDEMLKWRRLFLSSLKSGKAESGESIADILRSDLMAIKDRDPACPGLAHAMLFFKGFQGIQVYRVANVLWRKGQRSLASFLQSRSSQVFAMDIHPAALIGSRVMVDHATGVVIGETAVVGNGCTLLHAATLGGTGKVSGDRHPKLGENVLVGAGASILGNVKIGDGAKIGASAVVLSDIPAHATAIGAPAKVVGAAIEENPASKMDTACRSVSSFKKTDHFACPFRHLGKEHSTEGLTPYDFAEKLERTFSTQLRSRDTMALFFELDKEHKGHLSVDEFESNLKKLEEFAKSHTAIKS